MKAVCRQIGTILLASAVLAVVVNSVHPRKIPWVQNWSRQVEARARQQKIKIIPLSVALGKFQSGNTVFVDARSSREFARGHIAGAVSIPFEAVHETFAILAELIGAGDELVIYCTNRECDDALLLASELRSMGCSNLVLYIDGFDMWQKHGGEVE